jgi:hypothetical protein
MMQSEPVPVQLCGFFTNTYILGRCGWHIASDDNYRDPLARSAVLHHKELGLSLFGRFNGIEQYRRDRMERAFGFGAGSFREPEFRGNFVRQADAWYAARDEGLPHIEIHRAAMSNSHVIRMPDMQPTMSWRDTVPEYTEGRIDQLHRLPLFAQLYEARPETQELIVEPQDVQALLDQILAAQGPMRREIRARDKRRERDWPDDSTTSRQVHAQIISLAA